MPKQVAQSAPPGIAKQWPTLLMIKLGRITMHRFTQALEPFGIRPRHVAALIELRRLGSSPLVVEQAERADPGQLGDRRWLVAAVLDVPLELLERAHLRQRILPLLGRSDVDEAHAVIELERGVLEAVGPRLPQLLVNRPHQSLVLLDPVGLH